jgi:hypothetical protein
MHHRPVLITALVFVALLGALTVQVMLESGPDVLSVVSLIILAMFGLAVYGAIKEPPEG